jgi:hypothetical protein
MERESLEDWADLHGHTIEPHPPPEEHCSFHGVWVYTHGVVDECPECANEHDRMARADAWHDTYSNYH